MGTPYDDDDYPPGFGPPRAPLPSPLNHAPRPSHGHLQPPPGFGPPPGFERTTSPSPSANHHPSSQAVARKDSHFRYLPETRSSATPHSSGTGPAPRNCGAAPANRALQLQTAYSYDSISSDEYGAPPSRSRNASRARNHSPYYSSHVSQPQAADAMSGRVTQRLGPARAPPTAHQEGAFQVQRAGGQHRPLTPDYGPYEDCDDYGSTPSSGRGSGQQARSRGGGTNGSSGSTRQPANTALRRRSPPRRSPPRQRRGGLAAGGSGGGSGRRGDWGSSGQLAAQAVMAAAASAAASASGVRVPRGGSGDLAAQRTANAQAEARAALLEKRLAELAALLEERNDELMEAQTARMSLEGEKSQLGLQLAALREQQAQMAEQLLLSGAASGELAASYSSSDDLTARYSGGSAFGAEDSGTLCNEEEVGPGPEGTAGRRAGDARHAGSGGAVNSGAGSDGVSSGGSEGSEADGIDTAAVSGGDASGLVPATITAAARAGFGSDDSMGITGFPVAGLGLDASSKDAPEWAQAVDAELLASLDAMLK